MNDIALNQLKILVERAVRPVRATMVRKRRMREELLAHLTAIFEEESAKLGDERAALDRAAERFGNPAGLTAELQQTVPRWDRFSAVFELLTLRPGESPLRLTGRLAVVTAVFFAVVWLALLPKFLFGFRRGELGFVTYVLFVVSVSSIVMNHIIAVLAVGIHRAIADHDAARGRRRLWFYGAASAAVLPVFAFLWYFVLTGDLAASLTNLGVACCIGPFIPFLFIGVVRSTADQVRHNEEWAGLRIE